MGPEVTNAMPVIMLDKGGGDTLTTSSAAVGENGNSALLLSTDLPQEEAMMYESPILNFSSAHLSWVTAEEADAKYLSVRRRHAQQQQMRQDAVAAAPAAVPAAAPSASNGSVYLRAASTFVDFFRNCSPYIHYHRGKTFVIHVPGQMLLHRPMFEAFMQDVALVKNLGVRVVLVGGSRPQIDRNLRRSSIQPVFAGGLRISTPQVMEAVLQASGHVRFEMESALQRRPSNSVSLRTPNVVSGNFFTAQPIGVVDGVDFGYTGRVRKVDVHKIGRRLDEGDIVVLSNIGFAPSGALFNCQSEEVASSCAAQLKADKLIFMTEGEMLVDLQSGTVMHNVPLAAATEFLRLQKARNERALHDPQTAVRATTTAVQPPPPPPPLFYMYLMESVKALKANVIRAHLINMHFSGAILTELFTRDGLGLMISRDIYEGIRSAKISDVSGILELIQPLVDEGVLVARSRETLESEIHHFVVVVRDGMVTACAALVPYDDDRVAEIGCFVVSPQYRGRGKGDAMLGFLERRSLSRGIQRLFILSVRAFHWFLERGFREGTVDDLPAAKRAHYNYSRNSKIYIKDLTSQRAVDEEELLRGL